MNRNRSALIDQAVATELRAELGRQRPDGITTKQMAEQLGWRRATLTSKLNGRTPMTAAELVAISDALGLSANEVLDRAGFTASRQGAA